jgi:hypothetical protein
MSRRIDSDRSDSRKRQVRRIRNVSPKIDGIEAMFGHAGDIDWADVQEQHNASRTNSVGPCKRPIIDLAAARRVPHAGSELRVAEVLMRMTAPGHSRLQL